MWHPIPTKNSEKSSEQQQQSLHRGMRKTLSCMLQGRRHGSVKEKELSLCLANHQTSLATAKGMVAYQAGKHPQRALKVRMRYWVMFLVKMEPPRVWGLL